MKPSATTVKYPTLFSSEQGKLIRTKSVISQFFLGCNTLWKTQVIISMFFKEFFSHSYMLLILYAIDMISLIFAKVSGGWNWLERIYFTLQIDQLM